MLEGRAKRRAGSLNFPKSAVGIDVFLVDAQEGPGFADGFFVGGGIQAHGVSLAEVVVVFETETVLIHVQDLGCFHSWLRAGHV